MSTSPRTTAPVSAPTSVPSIDEAAALEHVERADRVGALRLRQRPARAGLEAQVPDGDVGLRAARPRVRRRRRRRRGPPSSPAITVTSVTAVVVDVTQARDVAVPQHREVRLDELVLGGQVQPDLEQLERVRLALVEQREHLRVDDALAGGEPLHVAPAEAGGGAERVGVVDEALADVGDGLEARGAGGSGSPAPPGRGTSASRRCPRSPGPRSRPSSDTAGPGHLVARPGRRRRGGRRTGTGRSSATGTPAAPSGAPAPSDMPSRLHSCTRLFG